MDNVVNPANAAALMRPLREAKGENLLAAKSNQIRAYDFKRPTKFGKDLLRTLVMVHDNFARLLQNFIVASLRTSAQVYVQNIKQYVYSEYTQLLPNPGVVATLSLEPLPGTCLVELSQNIAYAIVDRVFGGGASDTQPKRGLSEIELAVAHRILTDLSLPMQESWRHFLDLKPVVGSMETNPIFLQTSVPSEVLAVITLHVQIGEHTGHMAVALPYSTVHPVMERLSPGGWLAAEGSKQEGDPPLRQSLEEAPVRIRVDLGTASLKVGEFAALNVGDVIQLDAQTTSELPVYVGNTLNFLGSPGMVGKRMAIQIRRRLPTHVPER